MNKLDKNYNDYQYIEITDKKLIEDFLNSHMAIWDEDIINFKNLKQELTLDNIKQLDFYSYIGLDEELEYTFILNDNTQKHYALNEELIYKWLESKDLIK